MKNFLLIAVILFFTVFLTVRAILRTALGINGGKRKRRGTGAEAPKRSRKNQKKKVRRGGTVIIIITAIFAVVFAAFTGLERKTALWDIAGIFAKRVADVETEAKCVYLINADTGEVLYDKNSGVRTAPASTAKILTALTADKHCQWDETVTAGDEVRLVADDASRAQVYLGDELNVEQLMTAMLLPSGNDAAYVTAAYVGRKLSGSDDTQQAVASFTAEMNSLAAELGATDSCFTTPDGYDDEGQYTTARDMAVIACEFIKHGELMDTAGQYRKSEIWTGGKEVTYYNTNKLIDPNSDYYTENVTGIKTGTSDMAGACLIASAEIDGQTYICALLGGSEEGRFEDIRRLFKNI